jgi:hypothetical protein
MLEMLKPFGPGEPAANPHVIAVAFKPVTQV